MELRLMLGYGRPRAVGALFSEYTEMVAAGEAAFQGYLDRQRYGDEVHHLEKKYGMPDGRLYLAYCDAYLAGCIALRRLDARRCEMKRLYVKPAYRGAGVGAALVRRIIADARAIGYEEMLLDTFPFLEAAIRLYRRHGFSETERYNDSPIENTVYMRLALDATGGRA